MKAYQYFIVFYSFQNNYTRCCQKEIKERQIASQFCKMILDVRSQTSNAAVLGEFGGFPLYIFCKERALQCWLHITKMLH